MYSPEQITRTVTTRWVRQVAAVRERIVEEMSETSTEGLLMRVGLRVPEILGGLTLRGGGGGGRDWRAMRFSLTRVEAVRLRPPRREEEGGVGALDGAGDGAGEVEDVPRGGGVEGGAVELGRGDEGGVESTTSTSWTMDSEVTLSLLVEEG